MKHLFSTKVKLLLAIAVMALTTLVPATSLLAASSKDAICEGIGLTGTSDSCQPAGDQPTVGTTVANVITFISVIVGVISVIMIIIGGLKYITSTGDSSRVSSAKDTILYAIIGLVVVAMSQIIVQFVIGKV